MEKDGIIVSRTAQSLELARLSSRYDRKRELFIDRRAKSKSAAGYDWKKDAAGIVEATLKELKPGAVILLHDGRETRPVADIDRSPTVQALPAIIEGARQQGYAFAPLEEFLPLA